MKRLPFILVVFLFIFSSCGNNSTVEPDNNEPFPITKAASSVVEATNNFTFDIFQEIEAKNASENIFFSPLSMSIALSMAMNGANGETKQQIKEVIDFGDYTDQEINEAFKSLQDAFTNLDEQVEFSLANSAWYKKEYELLEDYRNILIDYYYAEIAGLDFINPLSVDIINDWIAVKTRDKITNMISSLDPKTVLVLVNAIYFNGTWTYEFNEDDTYDGIFRGLNDERVNCKMMQSGKIKTKYFVDEDKSMVTLPYGDGNFEMMLYMPRSGESISTAISELNASVLNSLLTNANTDSVAVHLPKFKIETETFSIKQMLINLGMVIPFTEYANFSNILVVDTPIRISDVLHKAFIEVNEEGTEAAAATVVIMEFTTTISEPKEKVIIFNKPFLFFIREVSTGEILFAGKVVKPQFTE